MDRCTGVSATWSVALHLAFFFALFFSVNPFFMCLRWTFFSMLSPSFSFVLLRRSTSLCSLCSGPRHAPKTGWNPPSLTIIFLGKCEKIYVLHTGLLIMECGSFLLVLKKEKWGLFVCRDKIRNFIGKWGFLHFWGKNGLMMLLSSFFLFFLFFLSCGALSLLQWL